MFQFEEEMFQFDKKNPVYDQMFINYFACGMTSDYSATQFD